MAVDVYREQIPEIVVPGKPLGRHIRRDPRDAAYPAELAPAIRSVHHQSAGLPLNQGQVGSCTANALCGALNSIPHWAQGQPVLGERDAVALYSAEEQLMGFGPYPPNDNGGTGQDVCQAALNARMLVAYQHATGIDQALRALVPRPVITGISWYDSFDTPDKNGLVEIGPGATVRGGHEVVADELIVPAGSEALDKILVGFWNSWSTSWGLGGRFYMTAATWSTLLDNGGDVTVPRTGPGWQAHPIG